VERHVRFPQRVNASFLQVLSRSEVRLRVFERGAGETLACGTGACAAVVAGIRLGWLDACVEVQALGGRLTIEWAGAQRLDAPVLLTGPAEFVFEGEFLDFCEVMDQGGGHEEISVDLAVVSACKFAQLHQRDDMFEQSAWIGVMGFGTCRGDLQSFADGVIGEDLFANCRDARIVQGIDETIEGFPVCGDLIPIERVEFLECD
jgi:hypothetical protein